MKKKSDRELQKIDPRNLSQDLIFLEKKYKKIARTKSQKYKETIRKLTTIPIIEKCAYKNPLCPPENWAGCPEREFISDETCKSC